MDAIEHCLTHSERRALLAVLDALLPPSGSFPAPSETNIIDDFILKHCPIPENRVHIPELMEMIYERSSNIFRGKGI